MRAGVVVLVAVVGRRITRPNAARRCPASDVRAVTRAPVHPMSPLHPLEHFLALTAGLPGHTPLDGALHLPTWSVHPPPVHLPPVHLLVSAAGLLMCSPSTSVGAWC